MKNLLLSCVSWPLLGCGVLLLASNGCTKDDTCSTGDCIRVTGRVGTGHRSATPVPGAQVQLLAATYVPGIFSSSVKESLIESTSADQQGNYTLQFDPRFRPAPDFYRLRFTNKGYGSTQGGIIERQYRDLSLAPGTQRNEPIHLVRLTGQLRVLITGFPGASATNSTYTSVSYVGYQGNYYTGVGVTLYRPGTQTEVGPSGVTEATCTTAANQYAHVVIYKTKAGIHTQVRDSIYCPSGTEVTYVHAF
ncbi:hypothetical protein MUN81_03115 [Hymenobacter sp. 5317J-9]|uniref:hypothetical protein n=1 Tax=Hymenobacter sp. 5317J-9 TaxID=2932250 RepID=UPI001FD67BE3|nr:hypothetical protein [Hymenobacter sp. 5317J-9]UOQ98485.1 hypothetical protein MUN81_03115 [Hymenobacter sp. 5317J-9]